MKASSEFDAWVRGMERAEMDRNVHYHPLLKIAEDLRSENAALTAALRDLYANLEKLWGIIDDIDTYSDMAKGDDKFYRARVERKQKERFKVMQSDGYKLWLTDPEHRAIIEEVTK